MPDESCLGKNWFWITGRRWSLSWWGCCVSRSMRQRATQHPIKKQEESCYSAPFLCPVREPSLENSRWIFPLTQAREPLSHAQKLVSMAILKHRQLRLAITSPKLSPGIRVKELCREEANLSKMLGRIWGLRENKLGLSFYPSIKDLVRARPQILTVANSVIGTQPIHSL